MNNIKYQKLNLFADCIPVKGYQRSIIYDLTRCTYQFIPNDLFDFINRNFVSDYKDKQNKLILNEYIEYLFDQEFIFETNLENKFEFPKIKFDWKYPGIISNLTIVIEDENTFYISNLFSDCINKLGVFTIGINFKSNISEVYYTKLLENISFSKIRCVDIIHENDNKVNCEFLKELVVSFVNIKSIVVLSNRSEIITHGSLGMGIISYINKNQLKVDSFVNCNNFIVNIDLFSESQNFNNYLNKKLFIDENGYIKNAYECNETFENIENIKTFEKLIQIITSFNFQKKWGVNKDIIDICKDCEFRYMCIDSKIPNQRSENEWYNTLECNYNPYISKWLDEDGYKTLAECGIISNENGFSIDHEKITEINNELWGE